MEGGLSLVIYTGSDPSSGTKPHNVVYFSGEEVDIKGGHTELEQVEQVKLKDLGKKLVEINLATQGGKSQPFFMSVNLPI